ncbi:class I tRNA ligase family protein, partial [bacterium]|nr:class I tRNA ligase family protein [candidate division CSSED10-310 bacterium]
MCEEKKKELGKAYEPERIEADWYSEWIEKGYFESRVNPEKATYCIVIPPPNVTGILHLGHVLNNALQDILIRWKRMSGFETLWLPGTDHAGIATQNVVEKKLATEGCSRRELGRERFVEKVWEWREKYGSTIIRQLKTLGCSCDWTRERFTMDEGLSRAVREVFIRLFEKGLIYKGSYIVNWCPRCHTAISDEEVEHKEVGTSLWYLRYPVEGD